MVIDTSAIIAVIQSEAGASRMSGAMEAAQDRLLSVVGFVEASMMMESRYQAEGVRELDVFLTRARIELIPVDAEQGSEARHAFARYGKGRHPAGLNLGDCFGYALARTLGQPLLFTGNDFTHTDITPAPY